MAKQNGNTTTENLWDRLNDELMSTATLATVLENANTLDLENTCTGALNDLGRVIRDHVRLCGDVRADLMKAHGVKEQWQREDPDANVFEMPKPDESPKEPGVSGGDRYDDLMLALESTDALITAINDAVQAGEVRNLVSLTAMARRQIGVAETSAVFYRRNMVGAA